jgi:hypothetical protein
MPELAPPPPAVPVAAGCERCRTHAEAARLAQERFIEIRQLQRQNEELLARLRALESAGTPAAGADARSGGARLRRLLDGPSIAELPVESAL